MDKNKKTIVKPSFRRPLIPQGIVLKSRLDRRKEEKKKSWKKELNEKNLER